MNEINTMAGAFTPDSSAPPLAMIRPSVAARLYAGAVDGIPTTMLETRPSAPPFSPLLSTPEPPGPPGWTAVPPEAMRLSPALFVALGLGRIRFQLFGRL